ncbi:MAG: response regulator, partial [Pseudomonadota bacterium]|nr:response regulator [Pseudomonadota bacterium]
MSAPNPGSARGERSRPVRVLIVDDSALVRSLLTELLSADPDIDVVGTAADAFVARDRIKQLHPDVLTLDVEMPRMDGLTFLQNLMRLRPMPVVMVSTLTRRGATVTLDALALGAVDFIAKPEFDAADGLADYARVLAGKIKQAADCKMVRVSATSVPTPAPAPAGSRALG